jgi:uncharacterized protein (DUF2345 family)
MQEKTGNETAYLFVTRDSPTERRGQVSRVMTKAEYFVERADGPMLSGRVDANGQLPRIETDIADKYMVHWRDDALTRTAKS